MEPFTQHLDLAVLFMGPAPTADPDVELVFDAWVAACDEAHEAYDAWRDAQREDQADAYAVYVAAADRESAAAAALAASAA